MAQRTKFLWCLAALTFFQICCSDSTTTPGPSRVPSEIAEKVLDSLVVVETEDKNGQPLGLGSGFFVGHNQIATCLHLIEGATRGTVRLVGTELKSNIEGIIASDKKHGLAILRVTDFGVAPLSLGSSDVVQVGEAIAVVGNPLLLLKNKVTLFEGTVTLGTIYSIRDDSTNEFLADLSGKFFHISAMISPGGSGGPVVNSKGKVIGISFITIETAESFNFAIPSNYLRSLLTQSKPEKPLEEEQSISASTYLLWGYTKSKQERYESAISDFGKAIRLEPDHAEAYVGRGLAKQALGRHTSAIVDFDTAIRFKPDFAVAYVARGLTKDSLGDHHYAVSDYNQAIRLKPDYVEAYHRRGHAKQILGQHISALADFDEVIRLKPDYAEAYFDRGVEKYSLGQHISAIADFDEAIRLTHFKPLLINAYHNRGSAKTALGQHISAVADFDETIRLDPNRTGAYYNRGIVKMTLDQHISAVADFNAAIRIKPGYAEGYFSRGMAKSKLGDYTSAVADFDKTTQLKPDYADAYLNQGFAKIMLSHISEAKSDFQIALELAKQSGDENLKVMIEILLRANDNYLISVAKRVLQNPN